MNQDIIYEILKKLRINGDEVFVRRLLITQKTNMVLESRIKNLEKPISFSILDQEVTFSRYLDKNAAIYLDDMQMMTSDNKIFSYKFSSCSEHRIRIYGHQKSFPMPIRTIGVHSIGEMTDLTLTFSYIADFNQDVLLDTSKVTCMTEMFKGCKKLNVNIGKNWDVSNVESMLSMFEGCKKLNQNIGEKWNVSKVKYMDYMFRNCIDLNKNIGKRWIIKDLITTYGMFYNCSSLNKNIGKNWDVSQVKGIVGMFYGCKNLKQNIAKKWREAHINGRYMIFWYIT